MTTTSEQKSATRPVPPLMKLPPAFFYPLMGVFAVLALLMTAAAVFVVARGDGNAAVWLGIPFFGGALVVFILQMVKYPRLRRAS